MGVLHIPKRKTEFGQNNQVIENETTFLVFGGMTWVE